METTLTPKHLEAHLARMQRDAVHVPIDALLEREPVACVDGRKAGCVAGAPGGNAGLFLLLLGAYEAHTGAAADEAFVGDLMGAYLDRFGHFYLHTDVHALDALRAAMARDPRLAASARRLADARQIERFVREPPVPAQPALLDLLVAPAHVGCGHLRLMLVHPTDYGARRALVEAFLRRFFRTLWSGDPRLVFDVLDGEHAEQAVVNVYAAVEPAAGRAVPVALRCPHYDDVGLFVHHPQAVAYLQAEHALFLARTGYIDAADVAAFIDEQRDLGTHQLAATLCRLAGGLPTYDAVVGTAGVRVEAHVPG